jgi:hypothetical protein
MMATYCAVPEVLFMQENSLYELLTPAIGAIHATSDQTDRLDELTERLATGEFFAETSGQIPVKCIDGRCSNLHNLMPNSAGGTETLMVADDLTVKNFVRNDDGTTAGQYRATLDAVLAAGYPVGGHTAEDLHGAPSGCGANDKLSAIYEFMAKSSDIIHGLASQLGVEVDDETHHLIIANAVSRLEFSDGSELLAALREKGGDASVDVLKGQHKEVVAVINHRAGTTLDRDVLQVEFGDNYQAFNVDVWALAAGARVITPSGNEREQLQKIIAMVYYNLATACVLCGPTMRVVVRS